MKPVPNMSSPEEQEAMRKSQFEAMIQEKMDKENPGWSELQLSISTWAEDSFGPTTALVTARRANTEMAELQKELVKGVKEEICEEAADVAIVAIRIFYLLHSDIRRELALLPAEYRKQILEPTLDVKVAMANLAMAELIRDMTVYHGSDVRGLDGAALRAAVLSRNAILFVRLMDITLHFNEPLIDLVAGKMIINRKRVWLKNGDGTGHHVRVEDGR